MIKPDQLQSIIRINGLSLDSADEEIVDVLAAAHYSREEAVESLQLIRQNITPSETRTDGLHKVFFSDIHLRPQEVSQLLGIDIKVTHQICSHRRASELSLLHFVVILLLSLVIAVTGVLSYMYINDIGLFHPTLNAPWE